MISPVDFNFKSPPTTSFSGRKFRAKAGPNNYFLDRSKKLFLRHVYKTIPVATLRFGFNFGCEG